MIIFPGSLVHFSESSNTFIRSYSGLGLLFGSGNLNSTHDDFKNDHVCNIFCDFFKLPVSYTDGDDAEKQRFRDTPLFLSISSDSDLVRDFSPCQLTQSKENCRLWAMLE